MLTAVDLAKAAQRLIAELEQRNLFLIPLDDRREWYRYHHLFADALRARLRRGANPEELAALHRRSVTGEGARLELQLVGAEAAVTAAPGPVSESPADR